MPFVIATLLLCMSIELMLKLKEILEFEGHSEGKADVYGDSVHETDGRLWRLWGVPYCSSY